MNANVSRIKTLIECPWKLLMRYLLNLDTYVGWAIKDGTELHSVVKYALDEGGSHAAWEQAVLNISINKLPEEHENLVAAMACALMDHWKKDPFILVSTELSFDYVVRESWHNCIFQHWRDEQAHDHWSAPTANDIATNRVRQAHDGIDTACRCWSEHRLVGTIDNVCRYDDSYAIRDYKTSAVSGDGFWAGFQLDMQITAYLIGVESVYKESCETAFVDAIFKPSNKQVENWNSKRKSGQDKCISDYIKCETRMFTHNEFMKRQFLETFVSKCNEIEGRIVSHDWSKTLDRKQCIVFNSPCDYFDSCCGKKQNFLNRKPDYVDLIGTQGEKLA